MLKQINLRTGSRIEFADITREVNAVLGQSGIQSGLCVVYVPHTTAGVTINENADPDVQDDINKHLSVMVPAHPSFAHMEGNSDAHIKASMMGFSQTVIIEKGRLVLGTWQSIYFCEFDGPRSRKVYIKIIESLRKP